MLPIPRRIAGTAGTAGSRRVRCPLTAIRAMKRCARVRTQTCRFVCLDAWTRAGAHNGGLVSNRRLVPGLHECALAPCADLKSAKSIGRRLLTHEARGSRHCTDNLRITSCPDPSMGCCRPVRGDRCLSRALKGFQSCSARWVRRCSCPFYLVRGEARTGLVDVAEAKAVIRPVDSVASLGIACVTCRLRVYGRS